MSKILRWTVSLALAGALAGAYGCGGGGGGSAGSATPTGSAALTASVERGTLAKRTPGTDLAPVDVYAVNEQGVQVDAAPGITGPFTLNLPWNHDYVLIFSDAQGILGAMVYGDAEQAAFSVESGVLTLDLGQVIIDPSKRKVKVTNASQLQGPANGADEDGDGIPDQLDTDRDNDGIPNELDVDDRGHDLSRDHDNDGIPDVADADDDGDGIDDAHDRCPRDVDNDGRDDDRDQCDKRASWGERLWVENGCGECHGPDGSGVPGASGSIRGVNVNDIVHALKKGVGTDGGTMPAFPRLVRFGPTFRAFLNCGDNADDSCTAGDAANGEVLFTPNCADCHTLDDLRGESAGDIAEVLAAGEGTMPAIPALVPAAADLAAYLAGCPTDGGTPAADADTDGDGVTDDVDLCPDTPVGTAVDATGCPVEQTPPADTDGDGVTDDADLCPDTPAGTAVDATGCPVEQTSPADTDGDGVTDDADLCPDTPAGTAVDASGCPVEQTPADADGDGVVDGQDACPGTPANVVVDAAGCPLDGDGDGVPDYLDTCPTQAGTGPDGCPVATPTTPTRPAVLDNGTCTQCHGDRSGLVSCSSSGWLGHNGGHGISASAFQEVSTWATGGTCP